MSILIKGAKMPRTCGYCFFNDFNICQIEHFTVADAVYHEERHKSCPLVEIPPHGRLIDADKLLGRIKRDLGAKCVFNNEEDAYQSAVEDVEFIIDIAPTAIESEVEDECID